MKGLKPRAYNIVFHTHTVSGMVISAVLFIIFFAGAVSLYKNEFYQWENPQARISLIDEVDYERITEQLFTMEPGARGSHEIKVIMPTQAKPIYTIHVPIEGESGLEFSTFFYNPIHNTLTKQGKEESTIGETLYRLHFFDQVPWYIGRYIAGFVSLFFVFAVLTGLLIHWKNIVSKFYAFSFKKAGKQLWTNAHTVFGLIGLPFQLMYALSGAFYMLILFVLLPTVVVLFKGDQEKLLAEIYPTEAFHEHEHGHELAESTHMSIFDGVELIRADYPDFRLSSLEIINQGTVGAVLAGELVAEKDFNKSGIVVLDLHSGAYKMKIEPGQKSYVQSILQGINVLHFGNFGGWLIKALYFVLALFTCFVIISGVMIWKEARNNERYSKRQRNFHHQTTMVYLSLCFSLFPATALIFMAEQLIPRGDEHSFWVNTTFFIGWLLFAIAGFYFKTEKRMTLYMLSLAGVLACLIPFVNGLQTGDWFWNPLFKLPYVQLTDLTWLIIGVSCLILAFRLKRALR